MSESLHNQKKAYLFAGIAIFFWSTVASAFKLSLQHLDPVQLVFFATLFSTLALFLIIVWQGRLSLIGQFSKADILRCGLLAFLNPCLYYIILLKAYDLLPAQEAMAINYSWVVMMVVLSIPILKQSVSIKVMLAILISYFGVILIATKGSPLSLDFSNGKGVLYALLTTVIWATFWLLNTKKDKDVVVSLFLIFLFSLPFISLALFWQSSFIIPTIPGLIGAAYIGFFEMGFTFVLWQSALKLSSTVARVSSLAFITPFLALLFVYLILGENILPSTVIGIILIISGLLLQKHFSQSIQSDK